MPSYLSQQWNEAKTDLPLVAILRGLDPAECLVIAEALIEAGFRILEVPLNSPSPFESIETLARALGSRAIVGAGTVLTVAEVERLESAGGQLCISPHTDIEIIRRSKALNLISFPAFFTPSEAFRAIDAGADALKLFPAELAGPAGLKAIKAVLPKEMPVFPVGGVTPQTMKPFSDAGAAGFGIGSAIFKPGDNPQTVFTQAKAFVEAWHSLLAATAN